MRPSISDGAWQTVVPCTISQVKLGHIYVYQNDAYGFLVCHEAVAQFGDKFLMQGRNRSLCPIPDPGYLTASNLIGEVVAVYPTR